jgi:HAD superfamily hydrolase (TIGR01509 family)
MTETSGKAVLWDMDGTLIDSAEDHWSAWRDTMTAEGIPITHEQFMVSFGQRNDAVLPAWLGASSTPERVERIGLVKEANYRRRVRQHGTPVIPGAIQLLRRLREQGWLQAIASSAPRLNIDVVLDVLGLAPLFQAVVAAEDVEHGKPDPQVFLTAAARLNVAPSRAVVLEDGRAGLEGARRAGMRSIGLSRDGTALAADLVVRSLEQIPPDAFTKLLGAPLAQ